MIITVELLLMLLMLLLIGAFAGVIAGLLGVGGGIILVPAFFFAFEFLGYGSVYLMQICLATSLATIVITSIRSVQLHNSKDNIVILEDGKECIINGLTGYIVVESENSLLICNKADEQEIKKFTSELKSNQ